MLAAVTAGVYLGWHTPELTTPESRLRNDAVWRILQFVLNALLFVLVGLQLPAIVDALGDRSWATLLGDAALDLRRGGRCTRIIWMFPRPTYRVPLPRAARAGSVSALAVSDAARLGGHAGLRLARRRARGPARDRRGTPFPGAI